MRIVYLGTPDFAVPSLKALVENGFNVVGVVTTPDRPSGRGLKMNPSPVKVAAEALGIPVLTPERLKAPEFLEQLRALKADLQFVVAFRMLPEVVWNMPPMGTVNLHGSLLPKYRGAAPINRAIMNGDTVTGVTIFRLKHEIDTGDLIFRKEMQILPGETATELHDRMMEFGAKWIVEAAKVIENGTVNYLPQSEVGEEPTLAPKIFREDCKLDFTKSSEELHNQIRGLSYYPGAYCTLDGKNLKVFKAEMVAQKLEPGQLKQVDDSTLLVGTSTSSLKLIEIQLEGKKKMNLSDFLRGYKIQEFQVF